MWACFSNVAHHVLSVDQAILDVLSVDRQTLLECVHSRVGTIYSPAHALAFVTDPFYYFMRIRLTNLHGTSFFELGRGSLFAQCRTALIRIAGNNEELKEKLLEQFAYFLAMRMEGSNILASRKLKPSLIWAQVDEHELSDLAHVLVQVHGNPAGAVGGERNHKTNNRVRSKQRVRLGVGKCEKQVGIAFNSLQLRRSLAKKRIDSYTALLSATGETEEQLRRRVDIQVDEEEEEEEQEEDDIGQGEFRVRDGDEAWGVLNQCFDDGFDEIVMQEGQV